MSDHRASARLPHRDAAHVAAEVLRRARRRATDDERQQHGRSPTGRSTRRSASRSRTRAPTCTSPAPRSTPTTWSRRTKDVLHAWPLQAPHAHARIIALRRRAGLRRARRGPGADRGRRARASTTPASSTTSRCSRPRSCSTATRSAGCWARPRTPRAPGAEAIEVEYEPLPVAADDHRGDRRRELPGQPAHGRARRRRGRARRRARTGSAASSSSAARSTSTSRPTPRWPRSTRTARCSCSRAPSTRPRPRTSSRTCSAWPAHEVTVQCLRAGGGFGGKEMQPHGFAAIAALGATITGRPVRLRLNRTQDITMTGKRHPFHADLGGRLRRRPAAVRAALHADQRRRLEPRPVRAGARPRAVPHRQRVLDPEHRACTAGSPRRTRPRRPRSAASAARRA